MFKRWIFRKSMVCISKLSDELAHRSMQEASDREFIKAYIDTCLPYLPANPEILEFDGGITYADAIIEKKGGKVFFATKRGREDRHNKISYELDLEIEELPGSFDVIIATQVLGSFVDPCMVVKRFERMLKHKGCLILTVSGPSYPCIRGLMSFFSKEGLTRVGQSVFGMKNVKNIRAFGDIYSAICMMNYVNNSLYKDLKCFDKYKHEVINGILCVKE